MPENANISERRLIECIVSARLWTTNIQECSNKMQALADRYTIAASLISTFTGLTAWGTIAASPGLWAQVLVGVMAFAAAAVAVIPKVKGYGECAVKVMPLSTKYGSALGGLIDALAELESGNPNAQTHSQAAVAEFEKVKAEKDASRFPIDLQSLVDRVRPEAIEKEEKAAAARKAESQKKVA